MTKVYVVQADISGLWDEGPIYSVVAVYASMERAQGFLDSLDKYDRSRHIVEEYKVLE